MKKLWFITSAFLLGLIVVIFSFFDVITPNAGAQLRTFVSEQLAETPSNGEVLQTNGSKSSWVTVSSLGVITAETDPIWTAASTSYAISTTTLNLYVATTGSDTTGDGSQANPFLTTQKALTVGTTNYRAGTLNINHSDGIYSGAVTLPSSLGPIYILGNSTTPDNVIFTNSGGVVFTQDGVSNKVIYDDFTVATGTTLISLNNKSKADIGCVAFKNWTSTALSHNNNSNSTFPTGYSCVPSFDGNNANVNGISVLGGSRIIWSVKPTFTGLSTALNVSSGSTFNISQGANYQSKTDGSTTPFVFRNGASGIITGTFNVTSSVILASSGGISVSDALVNVTAGTTFNISGFEYPVEISGVGQWKEGNTCTFNVTGNTYTVPHVQYGTLIDSVNYMGTGDPSLFDYYSDTSPSFPSTYPYDYRYALLTGAVFTGNVTSTSAVVGGIRIPEVYTTVKDPTGFPDYTTSAITFTSSTRTFTIAPVSGSYDYYIQGVKYTTSTPASLVIPTTAGQLNYIYIDSATNVLTQSSNVWDFWDVQIATVYWNGTNGLIGFDRHGISMDWATHRLHHNTEGTRYESGFTGTFNNANTFALTAGILNDEDNVDSVSATTTARLFYRTPASGFTFDAIGTTYFKKTCDTDHLCYDNNGSIDSATTNEYVNYWVFGTNDRNTFTYVLMGQNKYTLLSAARAETPDTLSLGTLPFPEMKLLYKVTLRDNATTYIETVDYRENKAGVGNAFVATSHSSLTGLSYSSAGHIGFAGTDVDNIFTGLNTFSRATTTQLTANTLFDNDGDIGISGQVLSSTGAVTNWVNACVGDAVLANNQTFTGLNTFSATTTMATTTMAFDSQIGDGATYMTVTKYLVPGLGLLPILKSYSPTFALGANIGAMADRLIVSEDTTAPQLIFSNKSVTDYVVVNYTTSTDRLEFSEANQYSFDAQMEFQVATTSINRVPYYWPSVGGNAGDVLTFNNNYLTWDPAVATGALNAAEYFATTTHANISSLPALSITKSQVSDFGTYEAPLTFNYPLSRSVNAISTVATSSLGLLVNSFASPNISQWTNDSLYITQANASTTFQDRADWTTHDSYPSACSAGAYVTAIGDTLTCSTPAGGGDAVLANDQTFTGQNRFNATTTMATTTMSFGSKVGDGATYQEIVKATVGAYGDIPYVKNYSPTFALGTTFGAFRDALLLVADTTSAQLLFANPDATAYAGIDYNSALDIINFTNASGGYNFDNGPLNVINTSTFANGNIVIASTSTLDDSPFISITTDGGTAYFQGAGFLTAPSGDGLTGLYSNDSALVGADLNYENPAIFLDGLTGNMTATGSLALSTSTAEAKLDVWGTSGGKILTLFSNAGDKFLELLNTGVATLKGVWDYTLAVLKLPNSATAYTNTAGEIAIDTTTGQLRYNDGNSTSTLVNYQSSTFTFSTSTAWTATTTIPLGVAIENETWVSALCYTDVGTLNVSFTDGTNAMNLFNASTTVGTVGLSTNNTFTGSEKRYVNIGTPATSPTKVSCSIKKRVDPN